MFIGLLLLLMFLVTAGFAVDLNFAILTGVELQTAVDAGATAGAQYMVEGVAAAQAQIADVMEDNIVAGRPLTTDELTVEFGEWDRHTRTFTVSSANTAGAVRLVGTRRNAPVFFAHILGFESFNITRSAVATFKPRDIIVILDYSGSMNDDSELRHISRLGSDAIIYNLWQIYNELGKPEFGTMTWWGKYISTTKNWKIRDALGLKYVPYPYPGGSWYDYFDYVKYDDDIEDAGYRKRYGYLTLVNYWLDEQPMYSQTPDLWMTSEQPLRALKNAVALFVSYVDTPDANDQVGLVAYTSYNGTAVVEEPLTFDLPRIVDTSNRRQAGHYHTYTNIGDGIRVGREEMLSTARAGTSRLLVLITDGKANRPSWTDPRTYALDQAEIAADANIQILTISLGADADSDLMAEIAEETKGRHFNIPGGQSVAEYEQDLLEVFREIALHRPLRMVQ